MYFNDFIDALPKKLIPNQYILVEMFPNTPIKLLGSYNTEIQALRVQRKVSHEYSTIIYGTSVVAYIGEQCILMDYIAINNKAINKA